MNNAGCSVGNSRLPKQKHKLKYNKLNKKAEQENTGNDNLLLRIEHPAEMEIVHMTLIELQKILGERIEITNSLDASSEELKSENEKSDIIARIAKQMINNADVVLRTNKLMAENKVQKESAIAKMIGEDTN